jgi:hypothetical protein
MVLAISTFGWILILVVAFFAAIAVNKFVCTPAAVKAAQKAKDEGNATPEQGELLRLHQAVRAAKAERPKDKAKVAAAKAAYQAAIDLAKAAKNQG